MSSTKRSLDGEGEDDSNKKHKSDESTTSATTDLPPSIDRISVLPDVLHSHILTFLPLKDLESSLRVSNRWLYIVDKKMPPIQGISGVAPLQKLATANNDSALSRHVSRYGIRTEAPWLTPLQLTLLQLHRLSLMTPHLKELAVRTNHDISQLIMLTCTVLHSLVDFRLMLRAGVQGSRLSVIDFHPLRARSELNLEGRSELEFYLELFDNDEYVDREMTVEQIDDLRAIKQNRLPCSITRNPTLARRLLQEPHDGWTFLSQLESFGRLEEENANLLLKLTNLNQLTFRLGKGPFYDSTFLAELINLTDVTILMDDQYSSQIIDILMGSLQHLHKLTRLSISGSHHLSSDHLTHLLLQLPSLETLQLHNCPKVQSSSNLKCRSLLVS